MGHADIKTTMVYTHYAPGANEAELVNGVFGSQVAEQELNDELPADAPVGRGQRGRHPSAT